jgi:copper chaperone CopZ
MTETTKLRIAGMACGSCVSHVTRALDGMTGVVHVEVDLAKGEAIVEHGQKWVGEASAIAALKDAGYRSQVTSGCGE